MSIAAVVVVAVAVAVVVIVVVAAAVVVGSAAVAVPFRSSSEQPASILCNNAYQTLNAYFLLLGSNTVPRYNI
jgi:cell division protein FtsN